MAETTYDYNKTPVNIGALNFEIENDAGITTALVGTAHNAGETPNNLHITFQDALSGEEKIALDALVTAHTGTPLNDYETWCFTCELLSHTQGKTTPTECPICSGTDIKDESTNNINHPQSISRWLLPLSDGSDDNLGDVTKYMSSCGFVDTEAEAQVRMPKSKVQAINLYVKENTTIGASTVTLRKNGADTALTFEIGTGATGWFRATGEIDFADGDLLSTSITIGPNSAKIISFGTGCMEVQS